MPTELSREEMLAKVDEHGLHEAAFEWEATLATMGDTPVYLYYPWRLRCSDAEAITEAWVRLFSFPWFDPSRRTEPSTLDVYVNDDSVLRIRNFTFVGDDGRPRRTTMASRFSFEGPLLTTESVFFDAAMIEYMDSRFGADFRALPGVEEF